MRKFITKLIVRAFIAVASIVFFIVIAELILYMIFPGIKPASRVFFNPFATEENRDIHVREAFVSNYYLEDPELFWRLNPEKGGGEITREGFRAERLYGKKKESTYRILAIGDSCTYGVGADGIEASYPGQLEKILNRDTDKDRVEVINAGVPGYASLQGLRYLKRILPRYTPDLVIVQFLHNDGVVWLNRRDSKVVIPSELVRSVQSVLRQWRLYELLRRGSLSLKRYMLRHTSSGSDMPYRVPPEEYKENLIEMVRLVKGEGGAVLLVVPPALPPYRFRPDFTDYQAATIAAARETGAPVLDLTKNFDSIDIVRSLYWKPDEEDLAHLNTEGYALQAKIVAGRVKEIMGKGSTWIRRRRSECALDRIVSPFQVFASNLSNRFAS
jgi:lysophospholipase L1-like esterase